MPARTCARRPCMRRRTTACWTCLPRNCAWRTKRCAGLRASFPATTCWARFSPAFASASSLIVYLYCRIGLDCYKIYNKYNDCVAMLSLKKTAVAAGVAVIVLLAVYGTLAALGGLVIAILAIYCRHAATPRQKA